MIKETIKNKVIKNASWIVIGKCCQIFIAFIVGIWSARYLGPKNYGIISYATGFVTFAASLCSLGIPNVIIKEILCNKENEGMILGTAIGLRFISSSICMIIINIIVYFVDYNEPNTRLVVLLCSFGPIISVLDIIIYWYQAHLKSHISVVASLIAYIATSIYKIILLINNKPVTYFAVATSIDYAFIALILHVCYKINKGQKLSFSLKYGKYLLSISYHFILSGLK